MNLETRNPFAAGSEPELEILDGKHFVVVGLTVPPSQDAEEARHTIWVFDRKKAVIVEEIKGSTPIQADMGVDEGILRKTASDSYNMALDGLTWNQRPHMDRFTTARSTKRQVWPVAAPQVALLRLCQISPQLVKRMLHTCENPALKDSCIDMLRVHRHLFPDPEDS